MYRFLGRRVCANIDFMTAEMCVAVLEIYMHGQVRDDRVVKAVFRRMFKVGRTITNSPRMMKISAELISFFSAAWSGPFATLMKQQTALNAKDFVRTSLE